MRSDVDILIFVEDPGAANCVMGLPSALENLGICASILATGSAVEYLRRYDFPFRNLLEDSNLDAILDDAFPKLVLIGTSENPDTFGLQLIALSQERGILTIGIIDGPANSQHRFRGRGSSPLHHAPDLIIVPTEALKKAFVELTYPEEKIFTGGNPHYDTVIEKRRELQKLGRAEIRKKILPDAPNDRPLIVFAAEVSDGLDPSQFRRSNDYTLEERGKSDLRTNIVLEELLDSFKNLTLQPYLALRLHPKNTAEEFFEHLSGIDHISDSGSPLEVCFIADLVIGMTSVLLVEAAILGRPTLSIIPRECEKDWLDSIGLGLTQVATTREELDQKLDSFTQDWPDEADNQVDEVINFGSTERIAAFLRDKIADKNL
jgi:hypothetical protein